MQIDPTSPESHTDYTERTDYGFKVLPPTFLCEMENQRSLIVICRMKDKKRFLTNNKSLSQYARLCYVSTMPCYKQRAM
jgi:hypothetical protein